MTNARLVREACHAKRRVYESRQVQRDIARPYGRSDGVLSDLQVCVRVIEALRLLASHPARLVS
jgi:hypothetical protein